MALLRRPVEARFSQYRLLREQRLLVAGKAAVRNEKREVIEAGFRAEELKKKNVEKLMKEYNVLYKEAKYGDAIGLAVRAHELDPDSAVVTAAIEMAKRAEAVRANKNLKDAKSQYFLDVMNDAEMPPTSKAAVYGIDFDPKTWEYAKKRAPYEKVLGRKSERERNIERRLTSPVTVNFENTTLRQVIRDLSDYHDVNIVPDLPALQEAGVSLESPVTIRFDNIHLRSALNLILGQVKLTYVIKDEVLLVTTEANARGKLVTVTYPVADLVIPVENFGDLQADSNDRAGQVRQPDGGRLAVTNVNPYAPRPMYGAFGLRNGMPTGAPNPYPYGGDPTQQQQPPAGQTQYGGNGQPTVTTSRVSRTMEEQLIRLVTNTIKPDSWNQQGGPGTIEYYPLTLALIVNQTPDIQEQIQDLLAALRRLQDQEVAIEVRFITVSEDFFERIGVNFNVNIVTDRLTQKFEPALVNNAFVQDPNNFINNLNFGRFLSGAGPGGTLTPTLDVPITNNSFFNTFPTYGRYIPGGGLALGLAFLSDIQVFLFLEAVQGDVRSNLMQAPKLTMFNGQTATINAQSFQSLITNVAVIPNGDGTFLFVPQVTQQPAGVQLTLQPAISADRRFVRISLAPQFQALKRDQITAVPVTVPIFTNADGQGGGGQPVLITQYIQTPLQVMLMVQTTVVVPDGGTVLMGGLKQLSEERSEYGPPILSKIPYVNRLFKNVGYGRSTDSLLILVTPRIIIQEEEELRATGFSAASTLPTQQ
jgi:type II secretory pathway component GspD/PulD (secretin)